VTETGDKDSEILDFLCCFKKSYIFGLARGVTLSHPGTRNPVAGIKWPVFTQRVPETGNFQSIKPRPLGFRFPLGELILVTLSHPNPLGFWPLVTLSHPAIPRSTGLVNPLGYGFPASLGARPRWPHGSAAIRGGVVAVIPGGVDPQRGGQRPRSRGAKQETCQRFDGAGEGRGLMGHWQGGTTNNFSNFYFFNLFIKSVIQ
jgi:hypothetical protein